MLIPVQAPKLCGGINRYCNLDGLWESLLDSYLWICFFIMFVFGRRFFNTSEINKQSQIKLEMVQLTLKTVRDYFFASRRSTIEQILVFH